MNTFIALFRGINVGGNNVIRMAELKTLLTDIGYTDVRTYIQSGNVVFKSSEKHTASMEEKICACVKEHAGFAPNVFVLTEDELELMISANPFPTDDGKALHFYILKTPAGSADLEKLETLKLGDEAFKLSNEVFYLHAPSGIGRSKLAAGAERALGVPVTARNWNTIAKLHGLISS
jgi:uncharacterized protein (DUF1697 family)